MKRYSVYTGPTQVQTTAARLVGAGFTVVVEGTQHVYVETEQPVEQLLMALGSGWSSRDVVRIDTGGLL